MLKSESLKDLDKLVLQNQMLLQNINQSFPPVLSSGFIDSVCVAPSTKADFKIR